MTSAEGSSPAPQTTEARVQAPTCAASTDYNNDALNCGVCGNVCTSGLCYAGVCADDRAGHIFVVGNSYRKSNGAWDRVLGNALFLRETSTVNVLVYRGSAAADYNTGVTGAISRAATLMHRSFTSTVITSSSAVQTSLTGKDVLVIEPQPQLNDASLAALASEWYQPIDDFTRAGGIVIVLDAASTLNSGTQQVVSSLMPMTRAPSVGTIASVTAAGDQAMGRVTLTFALAESVGYNATSFVDGAVTDSGATLVAHRSVQ